MKKKINNLELYTLSASAVINDVTNDVICCSIKDFTTFLPQDVIL